MTDTQTHILVCCSFRTSGAPQGICHKKGSGDLVGYLESQLSDRGLDEVQVSSTGCLKVCDRGPAMIVYPEGHWYGKLNEDAIDKILDALAEGKTADEFILH